MVNVGKFLSRFLIGMMVVGIIAACTVVSSNGSPTTNNSLPASFPYGTFQVADLGVNANLHGAIAFPKDNVWNQDISGFAVNASSGPIIAGYSTTHVVPGFGLNSPGAAVGIPYLVVNNSQAMVPIYFSLYASQSDPGPYPISLSAPVEKSSATSTSSNRRVIVINRDTNRLYEISNGFATSTAWSTNSGAIFHLDSNAVRPGASAGWISADAAGMPVFPGLVRYDEVASGTIPHALRFTVTAIQTAYAPPANHHYGSNTTTNLPWMGMRVRLKPSFNIAGFNSQTKVIAQALKTYGMFVADFGPSFAISGVPDDRWNIAAITSDLATIKASDFEVVDMPGLVP